MNYIYDILVNFNSELYDFYEWNTSDNVTHIRKIPLFRISTDKLDQIKNHNIKLNLEFLKKIENKAERFTTRDVEKISYSVLFSDSNEVYALKFDKKGNSIGISKLLIDEEEDVLDVACRCNEVDIDFEVLKEKSNHNFKTRMQKEMYNYLNKSLNKLEKTNQFEKLSYLYFECFNEKEDMIDVIIRKLKQNMDNEKTLKTMYDFFKLISIN